jgi:TetR/AcrR family transcriptional regulator, transcriptional repressor for nem operon
MSNSPDNSRTRLLAATVDLVRANGYAATRVEDICATAGVTKGSFFHHFESKEDLAIAAAGFWNERASQLFLQAPFLGHPEALDRLLAYLDYRKQLMEGDIWEWSCYAGTAIQEIHETHPAIRDACAGSIDNHLRLLQGLIDETLRQLPGPKVDTASLALHIQAVIQGAFVMAKARQDRQVALDSIDHLRRYVEMLFSRSTRKQPAKKRGRR